MSQKHSQQTLVRVYTLEGKCDIDKVLDHFFANQNVLGLTVLRGIAGFGPHHHMHKASILELSNKLPIIIEFFHPNEGVGEIIEMTHQLIAKAHIVHWPVELSLPEAE